MCPYPLQATLNSLTWMTFSLAIATVVSLSDIPAPWVDPQGCSVSFNASFTVDSPHQQGGQIRPTLRQAALCDSGKVMDDIGRELILKILQQCWSDSVTVEKAGLKVKEHVSIFVVFSHSSGAQGLYRRNDAEDGNIVASERPEGETMLSTEVLALQTSKAYNLSQLTAALLIVVDPKKHQSAIWWSNSLDFRVQQEEVFDLQVKAWQDKKIHGNLQITTIQLISACCSIVKDNPTSSLDGKDIAWIAIVILFSALAFYIAGKILYVRAHRVDPDLEEDGDEAIEEELEMDERRPSGAFADRVFLGTHDIAAVTTEPRSVTASTANLIE